MRAIAFNHLSVFMCVCGERCSHTCVCSLHQWAAYLSKEEEGTVNINLNNETIEAMCACVSSQGLLRFLCSGTCLFDVPRSSPIDCLLR